MAQLLLCFCTPVPGREGGRRSSVFPLTRADRALLERLHVCVLRRRSRRPGPAAASASWGVRFELAETPGVAAGRKHRRPEPDAPAVAAPQTRRRVVCLTANCGSNQPSFDSLVTSGLRRLFHSCVTARAPCGPPRRATFRGLGHRVRTGNDERHPGGGAPRFPNALLAPLLRPSTQRPRGGAFSSVEHAQHAHRQRRSALASSWITRVLCPTQALSLASGAPSASWHPCSSYSRGLDCSQRGAACPR
jgi:hypothetical protein